MSNRELFERAHVQRWTLVSHRAAQALRLSGRLPGAHAGRRPTRHCHPSAAARARDSSSPSPWSFVYYFLSSTGTALARQHKMPVAVGVWLANVLFAVCGVFLLRQMSTGGAALAAITSIGNLVQACRREESADATKPCPSAAPRSHATPADAFRSSSTSTCSRNSLPHLRWCSSAS